MSRKFIVVGVLLLAATGCGGAVESESMLETPVDETGAGVGQEAAEVSEEEGEVSAMACSLQSYIGMGSCHQTCNLTGSFCANGTKQWSCFAINYEHWKSSSGADQYRARGWESAWVTKCSNTSPVNCPSFCG